MGKPTRLLEENRSHGRRQEGWTPPAPCRGAAAAALAFEASFLPPHHRGLVPKQVRARCGRRGPRRGEFCPFRRSLSASLRRRAHGGPRTAAEPVQPVRHPACAESRGGRLGARPRNLGFKGHGQGYAWEQWQSRVQPPAAPTAGAEQAGCPDIPAPPPAGKAIRCNRA